MRDAVRCPKYRWETRSLSGILRRHSSINFPRLVIGRKSKNAATRLCREHSIPTQTGRFGSAIAFAGWNPWTRSWFDLVFADPPYNIGKADWDEFELHDAYIEWSLRASNLSRGS